MSKRRHPEAHRLEVEWLDSTMFGPWRAHADVMRARRKATRCLSVGLLVARDRHGITLASSAHGGDVAGTVTIPKGAIRKVRRLR